MGIQSKVKFTGWLAPMELQECLSKVDILVNPSLRAWSETFCIMNIEAMGMGVPLVTFGVGGVGEYILLYQEKQNDEDTQLYTVTSNAVLVNEASPRAMAAAVAILCVIQKYESG